MDNTQMALKGVDLISQIFGVSDRNAAERAFTAVMLYMQLRPAIRPSQSVVDMMSKIIAEEFGLDLEKLETAAVQLNNLMGADVSIAEYGATNQPLVGQYLRQIMERSGWVAARDIEVVTALMLMCDYVSERQANIVRSITRYLILRMGIKQTDMELLVRVFDGEMRPAGSA